MRALFVLAAVFIVRIEGFENVAAVLFEQVDRSSWAAGRTTDRSIVAG